ncbi:restriction endonuclease subunit S [Sinomonas susongensis]|uniref:restriction endonuclease subunit S n=1 Tax=Sinomonas susongensis TaxID=1324851 RepID=UPI001108A5C9|nr:restriction endonuclease subunit S [Sinomonas susongensis]
MSRIADLIKEFAPNGVQFKTLGDIAKLVRGNGMPKTDLTDEGVGAIHYGQIYTRYGVWTTSTISFVEPATAAKLAEAAPGDIIITNTSENVEDVGKAVAWLGEEPIVTGGHATVIKHDQDPKFLSYWFQSESFFAQKKALATGTKVIDISAKQLAKVRVPVPPLEVQREIVRILDHFAELEAELEAELQSELEARRRQYAFYRDELLTSSEHRGVRKIPLGQLADFKYGFTASAANTGAYRFLRITDITPWGQLSADGAKYVEPSSTAREYVVEPGDLLMARTGATYGKTMLVGSDEPPAVYASFLIRIRFKQPNVLPAYYWHFAQSDLYWSQARAMVSTGGQPQFNANVLKLVEIPVPSVEEQERMVNMLDKFNALVNDLSVSLPAELTARRQQYKFYRDRLLTFEDATA